MLYETLLQPQIFCLLAASGFACGILFDAKNIFWYFFKKNKFFGQILSFFAFFATFFLFFWINLKTNFGEFRIFAVFAFFFALAIERFFVLNFVAKPAALCYNKIKEKTNVRNGRKRFESTNACAPTASDTFASDANASNQAAAAEQPDQ